MAGVVLKAVLAFVLQSYTNTLQLVIADVSQRSMDPPVKPVSQTEMSSQSAPCTCKVASSGQLPSSAAATDTDICSRSSSAAEIMSNSNLEAQSSAEVHASPTRVSPANRGHVALSQLATPSMTCHRDEQSLGTTDTESQTEGSTLSSKEEASSSGQIAGYSWQLPAGVRLEECIMMWVGPDHVPALTHLHLTFSK